MEDSPGRVVLGEESGSETESALAVGAGVLVHVGDQLRQGYLRGGKGFEAVLERGHQHGRGDALAGDVGYGEYYTIFFVGFTGAREHVVVVAGDGVCGAGDVGNGESRNLRRSAGQQPGLDLAGDLQVALHDDAVGDLKNQKHEKQQAAPEMEVEFDDVKFVSAVIAEAGAGKHP